MVNIIGRYSLEIRRMVKRLLLIEAFIALIITFFYGIDYGLSLFIGGFTVILGVLIAAPLAKTDNLSSSKVVINALKAELIKLIVIALGLYVAFNSYESLVSFNLILGLVIAALYSGFAVSKIEKID